ncbi:hypothetical protein C8R34_11511 [Nitrosomonas sp. Nm84]|nr:hypothetical protein C8R34_11511 [Nitrosomonas sp. Nm84]
MRIRDPLKKPQLFEVYAITIYFAVTICLILFYSYNLFNSL